MGTKSNSCAFIGYNKPAKLIDSPPYRRAHFGSLELQLHHSAPTLADYEHRTLM
jgi:hypothetical protein